MKPYIVAMYHETRIDAMHVDRGNRMAGGTGVVFAHMSHVLEDEDPTAMDGNNKLYFADNIVDAKQLANKLAARKPGVHILVAKTSDVFSAVPGPVKAMVMSEKGVLPA